ncbi:hypothetical protein LTR22_027727 [Elasticomyces elasticus]|nr:hypothetical protein LTR22_027727 [Elasticomyces elasticus]
MAASVDFIRFDSDMETSSTDDVVTEWNRDVQSSRDDDRHSRDVYYWMGKKYFMCVLAQHIASTTFTPTFTIDMDVRDTHTRRGSLMQDQGGRSLPSSFDHTCSGDYEGLMACIGQNVLGGSLKVEEDDVANLA